MRDYSGVVDYHITNDFYLFTTFDTGGALLFGCLYPSGKGCELTCPTEFSAGEANLSAPVHA